MKNSTYTIIVILLIAGLVANLLLNKSRVADSSSYRPSPGKSESFPSARNVDKKIDKLTREEVVVHFVKANGRLPDYYIKKEEARRRGWNAAAGNLCEVLPGRAIGGDLFTNRQKLLPVKAGRRWFEGDLNYACGRRNANRILYSSDGEIFVTYDHYKTVVKR